MSRRYAVITEIIAPYRIPVFNALAREGDVDLHVIFLSETDPTLRQWGVYKSEMNFSYEVLPSWRRRIGKHNLLLNRGLTGALRNYKPDVIVCGGYNYLASWQALAWAKWHSVPFVLWNESTSRDQRRMLFAVEAGKRVFIRGCDAFLVPGKASSAYLAAAGASPEKIFIAPNAIDVRLFAAGAERARQNAAEIQSAWSLPSRFFLFVGRVTAEKGVFDLLDGYAQLPASVRSDIGLVYVGDGRARDELFRRAAEIRPGLIRLVGFVQRDELPKFYALADVLVLPTHSDTWGLVVNEAMACGLPVIATEVAGCREDLVHHDENGFVVPPRDVAALTEAMRAMAGNARRAEEMGRRSAEIIVRYSPEVCAAGFASVKFVNLSGAEKWKPVA